MVIYLILKPLSHSRLILLTNHCQCHRLPALTSSLCLGKISIIQNTVTSDKQSYVRQPTSSDPSLHSGFWLHLARASMHWPSSQVNSCALHVLMAGRGNNHLVTLSIISVMSAWSTGIVLLWPAKCHHYFQSPLIPSITFHHCCWSVSIPSNFMTACSQSNSTIVKLIIVFPSNFITVT